MEIEVGEYVRTVGGYIYKSLGEQQYLDNTGEPVDFIEDILKHSKNIIDLIEVGDYVNGYRILEIHEALAPDDERILDIGYGMAIFTENIKSIVTKEQMVSIEYKVESEEK